MTKLARWKMGWAVVFCAVTAILCSAQVSFRTLVYLNVYGGYYPVNMVPIQGSDGHAYGTTEAGGNGYCSIGCGTVFKMTPTGILTTLYEFCSKTGCLDGQFPIGSLVLANGDFYGVTNAGGSGRGFQCEFACGTVFKITPAGTLTTLHSFCSLTGCADGALPMAGLTRGANGNLYGTTRWGGAHNAGTVFEITPSGELTTLHSFCSLENCDDGSEPEGPLALATDGDFYGETPFGGQLGCGEVFKVTPLGKLTPLHSFDGPDGCNPFGNGLIQATDGDLYGLTASGGSDVCSETLGTIFKITTTGVLTTFYDFCTSGSGSGGFFPQGSLVQASDGNFYGTTGNGGDGGCASGCGTIFEITPAGQLTTLFSFCWICGTGASPLAGLLQGTNGNFYGTTWSGGGTIFRLSTGLGPFVAFIQPFGTIGQTGGILGQGLKGATGVTLNGVPANFTVVSDTYIKATIPAGATTGYVTVTTPSGVLTSNVPFHVIQ